MDRLGSISHKSKEFLSWSWSFEEQITGLQIRVDTKAVKLREKTPITLFDVGKKQITSWKKTRSGRRFESFIK